ncbi:MAG: hypothetical protein GY913_02070 [Proteobacteria bacterium]|nr:hypothetical protein [Pseudomonadota bacterium]MCP4915685.1 hypothetical protein [Pseudomonadota bacterium]
MIRTLLAAGALALGLALSPGTAQATTLSELSVDQMTDASDLVVRGTVSEIWTELDGSGHIWTHAQVDVGQVLKGDLSETVIVSQLGGAYGTKMDKVHGAARFSIGEEAVFFLEHLNSGNTTIVGLWQGKYTVRIDPDNGGEMGVRMVLAQDSWYDHRFLPHPAPAARLPITDLETQVLDRLELGWDGQPIPGADTVKLERINKLQPTVKEVK